MTFPSDRMGSLEDENELFKIEMEDQGDDRAEEARNEGDDYEAREAYNEQLEAREREDLDRYDRENGERESAEAERIGREEEERNESQHKEGEE